VNSAFKLYRLQQLDTQLDHLRTRSAEIKRILSGDEAINNAQAGLAKATAEASKAQSELRNAEAEVKSQQDKLKQNQGSLYGGKVTNPKELQDLQHEAEVLAKHISALEDTQLEKIDAHESKQAEVDAATQTLEAMKAQRDTEGQTLTAELEGLQNELTRLQGERKTASTGLTTEAEAAYNNLRSTKGGLAVAKAEGGTCSACGAELSAAKAQAARSQTELARCDSCKRILYAG
jgi:predicted  nucleic acid-binding Zn-ribbon protein